MSYNLYMGVLAWVEGNRLEPNGESPAVSSFATPTYANGARRPTLETLAASMPSGSQPGAKYWCRTLAARASPKCYALSSARPSESRVLAAPNLRPPTRYNSRRVMSCQVATLPSEARGSGQGASTRTFRNPARPRAHARARARNVALRPGERWPADASLVRSRPRRDDDEMGRRPSSS